MYVCVVQWTGDVGWEKVMLGCRENGMFECRGNMGDQRTEEGKNRLHL